MTKFIILNKAMVELTEELAKEIEFYKPNIPEYIELRVKEYPPIGDQLDMLYWDKINSTNNWQETLSAIKVKYPKPLKI